MRRVRKQSTHKIYLQILGMIITLTIIYCREIPNGLALKF